MPTGGVLVVGALLFFALGVGTILYYGSTVEGIVAIGGLAVGLPAATFAATAAWRRMSLDAALDDPTGQASPVAPDGGLKGRTGKTVSPMRPSGTVEFDGKRVDAMTEGTMLDAGVWVRCVEVRRGQVIVRRMEEPADVADIDQTIAVISPCGAREFAYIEPGPLSDFANCCHEMWPSLLSWRPFVAHSCLSRPYRKCHGSSSRDWGNVRHRCRVRQATRCAGLRSRPRCALICRPRIHGGRAVRSWPHC